MTTLDDPFAITVESASEVANAAEVTGWLKWANRSAIRSGVPAVLVVNHAAKGRFPSRCFTLDELDAAGEHLADLSNRGLNGYYTATLVSEPVPSNERVKGDSVRLVTHFVADVDVLGDGHARTDLPPDNETALGIIDAVLRPSAIIASGGGFYPVWRLAEPFEITGPDDRARVQRIIDRLNHGLNSHGYFVDPTDLARCIRPIGVHNRKPGRDVRAVTLHRQPGPDYTIERLELLLPDLPERAPRATEPRGTPLGEIADSRPMTHFVDQFNAARTWPAILEPHGWTELRTDSKGITYWNRPDHDDPHQTSATTNANGTDRLIVFSTSTAFETQPCSYDRFSAYVVLQTGRNDQEARTAIWRRLSGGAPNGVAPPSITSAGEPPQVRFRRWSVTELLAADLTYQWDAVGLLVRPTYGVDTGELKTLKTYVGMSRMIGLAAGVPILGKWHVPERRRVLCYPAEGGRIPFTRRLIRLCEAHGVDVHDLDGWLEPIFDAGPLDSREFRDTLRGHLADYGPAFVHLDPLYPFQPMTVDSNKLAQVGLMLNEVQAICAEHDATFWITAHMNQSGTGFDLKRITGAGVGEWGDSWMLLRHREPADVARGRFQLTADIGSRQWGGGSFDIDFNIGAFDADGGTHDGPITFNVRAAGTPEHVNKDIDKRLAARRSIVATMRASKKPLTKTEIAERSTGASNAHIRAELATLIDDGGLLEHGVRKPTKGGPDAPMYVLANALQEVNRSAGRNDKTGTSPGGTVSDLTGAVPPDLFNGDNPWSDR